MLEALAVRLAQATVARLSDVLEAAGLGAVARLNAFFARARQIKREDAPQLRATFDVLLRPGNRQLYQRINAAVMPMMLPPLARILEQGRSEGVFRIPDADAAAAIVLQLSTAHHDAMAKVIEAGNGPGAAEALAALDRQLRFQGIAIDRILGLADGTLVFTEPGFLQAVMDAR